MLKYCEIRNFYSIGNEQVLDFTLGINDDSKFAAQPVIGFAGSNASGKTNALRAFRFVTWFASSSLSEMSVAEKLPLETFTTQKAESVQVSILVDINGTDYFYSFTIIDEKEISERLTTQENETETLIYERINDNVTFGKNVKKVSKEILADLPNNCSIVVYLAKFKTQIHAKLVQQYFNSIFSNIKKSGFHSIEFNSSMIKKLSESRKQKLLRILRYADIGIDNIEFKQGEESDIEKMVEVLNQNEKIPEELKNMILDKIKSSPEDIGGIVFSHNIDGRVVAFDDDNQSTGTIQLLALLDKVFDALENGSVLIIDELELNLHPDLVVFILNLFNSPYENPKGGQLIFSFHNSIFMQNLKPEQLWLAQKNKQGHTELYAAAAFEDLGDLHTQDLEKLYRAGRFAAKPAISYISQTAL